MAVSVEALLISSVLRANDYVVPMKLGMNREMFHVHQGEWAWLEKYYNRHRRLPSKQAFRAKFPDFPMKAVDDTEHYTQEVRQEHARYMLTEAIDKSINHLQSDDLERALKSLHGQLIVIQSQMEGESGNFDLIEDWDLVYEEVKTRVDKAARLGLTGIPTGFPTLDNLTQGPQVGDYWVIAARLGMGKTWMLIRMACAAVFGGHRVQYLALEQSKQQIAFRCHTFLSSQYGKQVFRSMDLMRGKGFNLLDYKKFLEGLKDKTQGRMFISDTSRGKVTPLTISAQIEQNHPDIVFVDYLTLMEQTGDDWRAVAKLSAEMKTLGQRYQIPVVVAAQINRTGAGKEPPRVENLSAADAIGQDADCVVTMAQQSPHVVKFRLAKFRNGEDQAIWYTHFMPNSGKFVEVSGDRAGEIIEEDRERDE